MKLLFFISSLQCGGAERVCASLCSHWADHGWEVTLATFDDGSAPPFFPLSPRVRHLTLGLQRRSTGLVHSVVNNLRRVPRLRRLVARERPDRVLAFIDGTNVLALLAARGSGIPVVVSERIDPAHHPIPLAWRVLRRLTYPWAHAIAVQTRAAAAYFPASWQSRIVVLPNPVPAPQGAAAGPATSRPARRTVVAMGRLERQKGFDLLIRAFASIAPARPDWDVTILGEGGEREALEADVARAGLSGRVRLPGRERDVASILRRSDLFVLPSRYEGFPNALCEAMACGLPVIAFDCPSGPAEIVHDGIDGRLVPAEDVAALAAALYELSGDEDARRSLGARASEIGARFSLPAVAALWANVLERGAIDGRA